MRGAIPLCGRRSATDAYPPRIARYRLIDMAGGEIGIINDDRASIAESDLVTMPDGVQLPVVEIYDDEDGREGDVVATLVVDDGSVDAAWR